MPSTEVKVAKKKSIAVAVGIVINDRQQVLIAFRSKAQHQGELWEFPGGKIESGETDLQGITRELVEEVGIDVVAVEALTNVEHDYGDKLVDLRFMLVHKFSGVAQGREGQEIKWVPISDLPHYAFPAANQSIIPLLLEKYHCS